MTKDKRERENRSPTLAEMRPSSHASLSDRESVVGSPPEIGVLPDREDIQAERTVAFEFAPTVIVSPPGSVRNNRSPSTSPKRSRSSILKTQR